MAYFPSFKPFYDPNQEQEIYRGQDGSLKVRSRPPTPPGEFGQGAHPNLGNERHLKVEPGWTRHVHQDQGDLFYINAGAKSGIKGSSTPDYRASNSTSPRHAGVNGLHSHDGLPDSNRAAPSLNPLEGNAVQDYEEKQVHSLARIHRKREQLQQAFQNKKERQTGGESTHQGRFKNVSNGIQGVPDCESRQDDSRVVFQENGTNFNAPKHVTNYANGVGTAQSEQQHNRQQLNGRQVKNVFLVPDLSKKNAESFSGAEKTNGAELFELLFGVVLCPYNQRPANATETYASVNGHLHSQKERKLVVQTVIPGSAADRSGRVHRGDMLVYINGQEVTWSNLPHITQTIRKEVRLTFQVPKIIGPTSCSSFSNNGITGVTRLAACYNLCTLVTGSDIHAVQQQLAQHLCAAMYLTLPTSDKETSVQDDILYCFPPREEKLAALRGIFLTLSSSLQDVVNSGAKSSCLQIGPKHVNVVYHQQGRDVFILAADAQRVPLSLLQCTNDQAVRMLCTVFGAVDRAFRNGDSWQLDQLFALMFHRLVYQRDVQSDSSHSEDGGRQHSPYSHLMLDALAGTPMLVLSEDNRLICDEILSEFEAVDFDEFLDEKELHSRRSYLVLGCSLYYKNYLVCSHLHDSDLHDMESFLRCHSLLVLAARQPLDEVVVWQEVYPSRMQHTSGSMLLGYEEPCGQCFMLIVGMKHFLLATLLEAGGCCLEPQGKPGPHPLFVSQARATLIQLDTEEVHMSTCCEERLNQEVECPLVTGASKFVSWSKQGKDEGATGRSLSSKPPSPARPASDGVFKFKSSPRTEHRSGLEAEAQCEKSTGTQDGNIMRRQGSKLSYGSNDSGGSGSSAGAPKSKSSRFSSLLDISSIGRSMSALHIDLIGNQTSSGLLKLTRGRENTLLYFIHHRESEGVLLTPVNIDPTSGDSAIQFELLSNFRRCVLNIRAAFQGWDGLQQEDERQSQSPFRREQILTETVQEHGVLFHFQGYGATANSERRQPATLFYWVVGRRYLQSSSKHELYVCFHESTSQSLVEMAFSLSFGA